MNGNGPTIDIKNINGFEPIFLEEPVEWPQKFFNRQVISDNYLFISNYAKDKLYHSLDWGVRTPRNVVEQGGILLGKVYCCENEVYNSVEDIILADTTGNNVHVDFSPIMWREFQDKLVEINSHRAPNDKLRITGWFHTHPNNLSVFMSNVDLETQRSNFNQNWQVSLVMNPHKNAFRSFFGGRALEGNIEYLNFQDILRNQNNHRVHFNSSPTIDIRNINNGRTESDDERYKNNQQSNQSSSPMINIKNVNNERIKAGNRRHRLIKKQPMSEFFINLREKFWDRNHSRKLVKSLILLGCIGLGAKAGLLIMPYLLSILRMVWPSIVGSGYSADGHPYSPGEIETIRKGLLSAIFLAGIPVVVCLKNRLSINRKESLSNEKLIEEYEREYTSNRDTMVRINSDMNINEEEKKKMIEELIERQLNISTILFDLQNEQKEKVRKRK